VPLDGVVQTALDRLDKKQRADAEIKVGTFDSRVMGDETLLVQVLQNLLSNGLKFTLPGQKPRIEITCATKGDLVRLEIRDNGIGIAPEYQDKIFKVFERLHGNNDYPGTGVGLAIVQRAVHKMRGRLGVSSKQNEGATFWIELASAH
jgi:signal transduction histidine kinase